LQYGGPNGELGASLRYLSQRYSMPYAELKGLLTDIGTEELGPKNYPLLFRLSTSGTPRCLSVADTGYSLANVV